MRSLKRRRGGNAYTVKCYKLFGHHLSGPPYLPSPTVVCISYHFWGHFWGHIQFFTSSALTYMNYVALVRAGDTLLLRLAVYGRVCQSRFRTQVFSQSALFRSCPLHALCAQRTSFRSFCLTSEFLPGIKDPAQPKRSCLDIRDLACNIKRSYLTK
jgi:hypothetical protein